MNSMLSTREASLKSNGKVTSQEFARLAKRKVIPGAIKVGGKWQLPEDSVNEYFRGIDSNNSKAKKFVKWWERTSRVPIITIMLLIVTLLVNSLDFFLNISSLFDIVLPGTSLYVDRAKENELLILVTEFSGTGDYDPTSRIYRVLDEAIEERNLHLDEELSVQIKRVPNVPNISDDARQLGERYRATMVIWGTFDNAGIEPKVEILSEYDWQQYLPTLGGFVNADQTTYNFYLAQGLPAELEFMSLVVVSKTLLLQDKYEACISLLNEALEIDLANRSESFVEHVYALRGQAYLYLQDNENAAADFEKAVELETTDAGVYNNLANIKFFNEEYDEALAVIQAGLVNHPDFGFALYNTQGSIYRFQGKYEEALAAYSNALNALAYAGMDVPDPITASIYQNRGALYIILDEYDESRADYLRSKELFPDNPTIYHDLGNLELQSQNFEQAIDYFNSSLERENKNPRTKLLRGMAYENLGEYEKARTDFETLIEQYPDFVGGYSELGFLELLEEQYEQAEIWLQRALEIEPNNVDTLEHLFQLYHRTNNEAQLFAVLEKLIEVGDDEVKYRYLELRGQRYVLMNDLEGAEEDFLQVLEYDPENVDALYGVGLAYIYIDRRWQDAIEIYDLLETIEPTYSALYLMRGAAFYLVGDVEAAREDCAQFNYLIQNGGIQASGAVACGLTNAQPIPGYAIQYEGGFVEVITPIN